MESDEREIQALLQLIDDPDQEVYSTVADKIIDYGSGIIPRLESLWESTPDESIQQRLETLIHRVHFQILKETFITWAQKEQPDLLSGAILIAQYQYPGLDQEAISQKIKKLERNIWLELNNYLTALEKVNIINNMFYNFFHARSVDMGETQPKHFFINKVIESKEGNALSLGLLYQILCERLDIPIYAIGLPRQFILAYFDIVAYLSSFDKEEPIKLTTLFFIDPTEGQIFSKNDVKVYLKKLRIPYRNQYFQPQSNKNIIRITLKELSLYYKNNGQSFRYEELKELSDLLVESNQQ